ncbi:hypothetical protein PLESTB_001287900 [Pleodorina starrii]|uniref:FAD-binding domain-containing protein n=1 Tax=Pleodorina starrii TaxID=330485 RepID=A0A9W6BTK8_9CHLO|nr:hypothetical protein PLESTM_000833100 [Pleodorina starrii]GLC57908.1 hypothetical protein PLESTB_001287900 [Pleodorina starrii]GLC67102.1 hypothetical protein PLESTF_000515500 [Pleodorina starrii]
MPPCSGRHATAIAPEPGSLRRSHVAATVPLRQRRTTPDSQPVCFLPTSKPPSAVPSARNTIPVAAAAAATRTAAATTTITTAAAAAAAARRASKNNRTRTAAAQAVEPMAEASPPPSPPPPEPCDALIVGAGPAGLATALLLSRREGWSRIVLLEKRISIDVEDADKSYVYMIDGRGFSLTDAVGVTAAVEAAGVSTAALSIAQVLPDGSFTERRFGMKDATRSNVWLPRRAFLTALYDGLAEAEQNGRVRLLNNVQVTHIHLAKRSGSETAGAATAGGAAGTAPIVVHARDAAAGGVELRFAPRLLVGADGLQSEVRRALEEWAPGAGLVPERYRPVVLDSPAAGLRYKVLRLPPNPPFRRKDTTTTEQPQRQAQPQPQSQQQPQAQETTQSSDAAVAGAAAMALSAPPKDGGSAAGGGGSVIPNSQFAMIAGVKAPRTRSMRLGLLPYRDPAAPRTANVIAPADHVFWSLTRGPQLGAFLQESFPQLHIPSLFTEQQLEAAAASRGGAFPRPQYLRHFTAVLPSPTAAAGLGAAPAGAPAAATTASTATASTSTATSGGGGGGGGCCGVALVGDAVHCFPPDLGQGVNSAMADVMGLAEALDQAGGDLGTALPLYESRRAPEAAALVELMTFGAPYQYNQDTLRRTLWALNVALRAALHKLAPWAFAPQTFVLVQKAEVSYAQMLQRVHATTRRIWALAGVLVAALGAAVVKAAAGASPLA